jgi:hypothetical protein
VSLAIPTNCTFDVYRGYAPATPCSPPNQPAAVVDAQGVLRQHVRNGRFGFTPAGAQPMHWTTLLLCDASIDIRDAWNAELNTFSETQADTVMMHDYPIPGVKTPFCVVQVQLRARKAGKYLRCYLDRAQPCYGVMTVCCGNVSIPTTLHATFTSGTGTCTCLNGITIVLTHQPNGIWQGSFAGCGRPRSDAAFYCQGTQWIFQLVNPNLNACQSDQTVLTGTCSPFAFTGPVTILAATPCCTGTIQVTVTP